MHWAHAAIDESLLRIERHTFSMHRAHAAIDEGLLHGLQPGRQITHAHVCGSQALSLSLDMLNLLGQKLVGLSAHQGMTGLPVMRGAKAYMHAVYSPPSFNRSLNRSSRLTGRKWRGQIKQVSSAKS
jgi:hypothetical protein